MSRARRAAQPGALALAAAIAAVASFSFPRETALAASNLQITAIDCVGHPRQIRTDNLGDTPQDLAGWKLVSDLPGEEFDLSQVGTLNPGKKYFVANGHGAKPTPVFDWQSWTYPWNPTTVYDPSAFVLWEDGKDFIQLVDAGGNVVSNKLCPIPPATPTPQAPTPGPEATEPPAVTDTSGSSSPAESPSDGTQTSDSSVQTVTRNRSTSGEQFGPPTQGEEAPLPAGGGPPLPEQHLPLPLMIMLAGAALWLGGILVIRLALARPNQGA